MMSLLPDSLVADLRAERERQEAEFPGQVCPATPAQIYYNRGERGVSMSLGTPTEALAKHLCDTAFACGIGTWAHILSEEHSEALAAGAKGDAAAMREELVQLMAVCARMIGEIDAGRMGF